MMPERFPDLPGGEHREALLRAARAALEAYLAIRSEPNLRAATDAVAAYRKIYGPLVMGVWVWTVDGTGELIKLSASAIAQRRG